MVVLRSLINCLPKSFIYSLGVAVRAGSDRREEREGRMVVDCKYVREVRGLRTVEGRLTRGCGRGQ